MAQVYGGEIDFAHLEGVAKYVFGELQKVIPDEFPLQQEFAFRSADKLGKSYIFPVPLTRSHGFTYATGDAGAFAINDAIAPQTKEATVTASEILLKSVLPYKVATSIKQGKQAFFTATSELFAEPMESARYRIEENLLYGGTSFTSLSADDTGSGTTRVWSITPAAFAAGILIGLENAQVDAYTAATGGSKLNTNAILTISKVDVDNKKLTIVGNATDLDAMETAVGSAAVHLFFKTEYGNTSKGLDRIAGNTGSLYGIDGATYSLWAGNNQAVSSAQLDYNGLSKGFVKIGRKGTSGQKFKGRFSMATFADLVSDAASARTVDATYAAAITQGHNSLTYHFGVGTLEIDVHSMIKEGTGLVYPVGSCSRIGSTDLTNSVPGAPPGLLVPLPGNAGYAYNHYSDQALFTTQVAKMLRFDGIVNGT